MKAGNSLSEDPFEDYYPTVVGCSEISSDNHELKNRNNIVSTCYYDICGRKVASDHKGFVIERTTFADGHVIIRKYMNY